MKYETTVSIVTVCFNCREDLLKTIKSVASQTYSDIEYIIIDGGSTDGSLAVLKGNNYKIAKWISEPDRGIYDAMNKGISLATGEWIIFMNAGDIFFDDNVLERIFAKKYSESIGIIYGDVELDFGRNRKVLRSLSKFSNENVVTELCHQGVFTRTSILKHLKYDISFKIFADINSFITIHRLGWGFEYIPITIATFEITGGISSNKPFLSLAETKRLYNDSIFSIRFLKRILRASNRYFMLKLLPKNIYNTIRYYKLIRKTEYHQKT